MVTGAMELLTILCTVTVFIVVQGQQPIVDKAEFSDGGTFTITCDLNRFTTADIPSTATTISELSIERSVGTSARTLIARYIPFTIPGQTNFTTNMPNWVIEATGGVSSGAVPQNNKATIKITAIVRDARCATDAGTYRCNASYQTPEAVIKVDRSQNVTGKATPENHVITLDQHNGNNPQVSMNVDGKNVSLSCKVQCPYGSALSWLHGPPNGNFVPYDFANDIQMVTPSPPSAPLLCGKYNYESILTLSVHYGETMYICVVKDDKGVVISQMNFTIEGTPTTQPPDAGNVGGTPSEANVGAIVGGVIGGLVLIAIIVIVVYFCWYRKRNDDDFGRAKEVEATDTTHAPPPVFYAEPKKVKKDERDGVRPDKGFTNEALDNSYDDSKDHRGPPQYINTVDGEDLPRYEKETHRGRSNKGYDDENEKNEGHGRRHRRDRKDKEDRDDRKPPRKDYEDRDKGRHYSTDDGTDNRDPQMGYGDPNMGTSI